MYKSLAPNGFQEDVEATPPVCDSGVAGTLPACEIVAYSAGAGSLPGCEGVDAFGVRRERTCLLVGVLNARLTGCGAGNATCCGTCELLLDRGELAPESNTDPTSARAETDRGRGADFVRTEVFWYRHQRSSYQ